MPAWLGILLFLVSPLLGGAIWTAVKFSLPGGWLRWGLPFFAGMVGIEAGALVLQPVLRIVESRESTAPGFLLALFNWAVLVLPLCAVDFILVRLLFRLSSTKDLASATDFELASAEELMARVRALAIVKIFYMGVILANALAVMFVGVTAIIPYMLIYTRSRRAELLDWLAFTFRERVPIPEALIELGNSRSGASRSRLKSAADGIRAGHPVVDSLFTYRLVGQSEAIELTVADKTGRFDEGLLNCAFQNRQSGLSAQNTLKTYGAMIWLWSLATATVLVVAFLAYNIIPKVKAILYDFGIPMPRLTTQVFDIAGEPTEVAGLGLSLLVITSWLVRGTMISCIGWQNLHWPWIQQFFPRQDTPHILRLLGYGVRSEISLKQALHELSDAAIRDDVRERVNRVASRIETGGTLGDALLQERYITAREGKAIEAAERAGHLDFALQSLADSLERTRQYQVDFLIELAKPVFLILLGTIIALVVIAIFIPLVTVIERLA